MTPCTRPSSRGGQEEHAIPLKYQESRFRHYPTFTPWRRSGWTKPWGHFPITGRCSLSAFPAGYAFFPGFPVVSRPVSGDEIVHNPEINKLNKFRGCSSRCKSESVFWISSRMRSRSEFPAGMPCLVFKKYPPHGAQGPVSEFSQRTRAGRFVRV